MLHPLVENLNAWANLGSRLHTKAIIVCSCIDWARLCWILFPRYFFNMFKQSHVIKEFIIVVVVVGKKLLIPNGLACRITMFHSYIFFLLKNPPRLAYILHLSKTNNLNPPPIHMEGHAMPCHDIPPPQWICQSTPASSSPTKNHNG